MVDQQNPISTNKKNYLIMADENAHKTLNNLCSSSVWKLEKGCEPKWGGGEVFLVLQQQNIQPIL